jgi:hypothetical protein
MRQGMWLKSARESWQGIVAETLLNYECHVNPAVNAINILNLMHQRFGWNLVLRVITNDSANRSD